MPYMFCSPIFPSFVIRERFVELPFRNQIMVNRLFNSRYQAEESEDMETNYAIRLELFGWALEHKSTTTRKSGNTVLSISEY